MYFWICAGAKTQYLHYLRSKVNWKCFASFCWIFTWIPRDAKTRMRQFSWTVIQQPCRGQLMNRHYSISTFFMYVIFTSAHASAAGCKLHHFSDHRDSDHRRATVSRLFVRSLIICEQDCSQITDFDEIFPVDSWWRREERRKIWERSGSYSRSSDRRVGVALFFAAEVCVLQSTLLNGQLTTQQSAYAVHSSHRVKERWIHGGRWWKMVQKQQDEDAERDERGRAVPSSLAAAARGVQRKYCCAVATWASARVIDDIVA